MRIGIIGNGVVGGATAEAFKDHQVVVYDVAQSRSTHPAREVLSSDIIFICLPTPQKDGTLECDTRSVDSTLATISEGKFSDANLVLRSTVPVGYTRRARETLGLTNLVHSPEFLTARTAKEDACNPTRMVIGYHPIKYVGMPPCAVALYALYLERWSGVRTYCMTSDESEAVKLFQNSFSAVKIAFFNEVHCLTSRLGLDWDRCLEALLAGGWINPMHTQVPGPDGKYGFGGTCLPKDLASLVSLLGDGAQVTKSAMTRNWEDRKR